MSLNYSSVFLRIARVIAFLLAILTINNSYAEFVISGEDSCLGNNAYAYYFSENAPFPDFSVKVNEFSPFQDLTFKLVDDPMQADLIFVDGAENSDMKVCKNRTSIGVKTIKVSEFIAFPNITVRLSEYPATYDYKIFISSSEFTKEEVAALFAVIWKSKK